MHKFLSMTAFFAVALGILTACQNSTETPKNAQVKTNTNAAPKVDEHGHLDDAPRITLADAKKDFDAGNVVFIDTRTEAQYKQERVKGALNIPADAVATRYTEIPKGKKIIAYCS